VNPSQQVQYNRQILEHERGKQVFSAALQVLTERSIPQARPLLLHHV
jgi:hypothetical protein